MAAQTYVALLRGINLGARNKVSMAELRELVEGLGADDVTTYVQSGNVVFRSGTPTATLAGDLEAAIRRRLGLDVRVLLRTKSDLGKTVSGNPFADAADASKLHVTFLAATPVRARVRKLDPSLSPPDEFRVAGRQVYLHCPNGYGRSKLSNAYFEQQLGVAATTRNWRTVTALADLAARPRGG